MASPNTIALRDTRYGSQAGRPSTRKDGSTVPGLGVWHRSQGTLRLRPEGEKKLSRRQKRAERKAARR